VDSDMVINMMRVQQASADSLELVSLHSGCGYVYSQIGGPDNGMLGVERLERP